MRILVACEESQVVTKELRKLGHEAYSNDIDDCSGDKPYWHLKMDCFEAVRNGKWDMIIMHPPCTAMSVSGNSTYGKNPDGTWKPKHHKRIAAVVWTQELWDLAVAVCDKVAMENPVGVLNTMGKFPKAKYVQPWQFGHMEQKKTGLWLHGLEPLKETKNVYDKMMELPKNVRERLHYLPPSEDRGRLRSKTYIGLAKAIANQWAGLAC
jgi:site-specific DNA-cytosine methylase